MTKCVGWRVAKNVEKEIIPINVIDFLHDTQGVLLKEE
jgi:hypothetical protein